MYTSSEVCNKVNDTVIGIKKTLHIHNVVVFSVNIFVFILKSGYNSDISPIYGKLATALNSLLFISTSSGSVGNRMNFLAM